MSDGQAYWIWYPGDFEIYQGLVQNLGREVTAQLEAERGEARPAGSDSETGAGRSARTAMHSAQEYRRSRDLGNFPLFSDEKSSLK